MTTPPVALVTGASRGIGRAIALELARLGHAVVVNYVSNSAAADEVVRAIEAARGQATACAADVANAADRQKLVETTLGAFGRLDVLVNNAAITSAGRPDLLELTEAGWDQVLGTNLKGPFFLSQLCARRMIAPRSDGSKAGGTIVNVSSISAFAVSTNRPDYCIAKAALEMMTWLFAARLAAEGIRVFEVCPGLIATDMTAPVKEKYDKLLAGGLAPMARWGQPDDVARTVGSLVTGAICYSTGQRIYVDGGLHIRQL